MLDPLQFKRIMILCTISISFCVHIDLFFSWYQIKILLVSGAVAYDVHTRRCSWIDMFVLFMFSCIAAFRGAASNAYETLEYRIVALRPLWSLPVP